MKTYHIRFCTGGCKNPGHFPHVYSVDPVDGILDSFYLCPGNDGPKVMEHLDDETGEPTGQGFIASL